MNDLHANWFQELLADHQPPCVSVYMPANRAHPVNRSETALAPASALTFRRFPVSICLPSHPDDAGQTKVLARYPPV